MAQDVPVRQLSKGLPWFEGVWIGKVEWHARQKKQRKPFVRAAIFPCSNNTVQGSARKRSGKEAENSATQRVQMTKRVATKNSSIATTDAVKSATWRATAYLTRRQRKKLIWLRAYLSNRKIKRQPSASKWRRWLSGLKIDTTTTTYGILIAVLQTTWLRIKES